MKLSLSPGSLYVLQASRSTNLQLSKGLKDSQRNHDAVRPVLLLEVREVLGIGLRGLRILIIYRQDTVRPLGQPLNSKKKTSPICSTVTTLALSLGHV